jgi:diadenylate cyclase
VIVACFSGILRISADIQQRIRKISMAWFHSFVSNIRFADILDIIVITFLMYGILTWLRKQASRPLIAGIVFIAALYGLARFSHMYVTLLVFKAGFTAGLVILVIVFQDEVRSGIERLLFWRGYRMKHQLVASASTTDLLVETVADLARDRIGALVVLKGRTSLERYLSGGISLNGRLSRPLLYSIFHPETPSHDGAVVVEADRIEKFAVRLPLSHNSNEIGDRGTRHTAGLGLSEHTDALVIIVSEEHGTITLAENGRMEQVESARLKARIDSFYGRIFPSAPMGKNRSWLAQNLMLKFASLGLAMAIWFAFSFRTETMNRTFTAPVEYRNVPASWVIEAPNPPHVQVSLSGMERAFLFNPENLIVSLNMGDPKAGISTVTIRQDNLNLPAGLKVTQILPNTVTLSAYRLKAVELPVRVVTRGNPPRHLSLKEITVHPASIKLLVSPRLGLSTIATEPLALETITENSSVRLKLIIPNETRLVDETQITVKAAIVLQPSRISHTR